MSASPQFRFSLTRELSPLHGNGVVTWIMLNPSTADETTDDPTIRRVTGFSRSWGFLGLIVVNLYPLRATSPADLPAAEPDTAVIAANIAYIAAAVSQSDMVVAAWGANVAKSTWLTELADETRRNIPGLQCLGVTKDGHPRHPLYVPASVSPQPFEVAS